MKKCGNLFKKHTRLFCKHKHKQINPFLHRGQRTKVAAINNEKVFVVYRELSHALHVKILYSNIVKGVEMLLLYRYRGPGRL